MKTFLQLLRREFALFWSNQVLKLLFFGAPLAYGILIGYIYNKGKVTNLPIIVVDEDHSGFSKKLLQMIEDNEVLHIAAVRSDRANLDELLVREDATCVVFIPRGFEKDILTQKSPEIATFVNTANFLTANYASSALQVVLGTLKAGIQMEALRKRGTPDALVSSAYEPFKTTFIKKFNRSSNYLYFLWPGVLATVLQQVLLLGLALSFASEFENGTFKELISKTSNTFSLIFIKIFPYLLMSFLIWLMYWVFTLWFSMPFTDNLGALTFVAGFFIISVSFIGILVSILLPSQLKATEVLMAVATPSFMISGFTWPLSQMPAFIQYMAKCIPLTHFLSAFRILTVEQGSLSLCLPYIINMSIIALVCGVLSFLALSFKIKKTARS